MRTDSRELLAVGIFGRASLSSRIETLLKRGREFSPRASHARIAAGVAMLLIFAAAGARAPRWIVFAQTPDRPAFDVASIKPNVSPETSATWRFAPGGLFTGENIPVRFLITTAFQIKDFQISGAPDWIDSRKYDIAARAEGNPGEDRTFAMLQGLLTDRFQLKYHRVTKQVPVYALVRENSGIKLRKSNEGSCSVPTPGEQPPGERSQPVCGTYFAHRGDIDGTSITMTQFITALSFGLDRPVIDQTRFTTPFDVHLQWVPEEVTPDGTGDSAGPSLFTVIREQLGLRLRSQKGPAQILVIDHIEEPDAN